MILEKGHKGRSYLFVLSFLGLAVIWLSVFSTEALAQSFVDPQSPQVFVYDNDALLDVNNSTDFCPAINHVIGNPSFSPCLDFSYPQDYGRFELILSLDFGEDYDLGNEPVSASLEVNVIFSDGSPCLQIPETYYPFDNPGQETMVSATLEIDQNQPEQYFPIGNRVLTSDIRNIGIEVVSYNVSGGQPATNAVRFKLEYRPKILIKPLVYPTNLSATHQGGDVYEFSWTNSCNVGMPGHELQLLHLVNRTNMPGNNYGSGDPISAPVDWSKSLTIPMDGSQSNIKLSVAEGPGYYAWRVRPIGNVSGGHASASDWGTWSDHSGVVDGSTVNPSQLSVPYVFEFDPIDADKNFIYSRAFVEGDGVNTPIRIGENMTYANGLNQVQQQQSHLNGQDQIITTQTLTDLAGRPSLTTLPVPLSGQSFLAYKDGFLQKDNGGTLRAEDYDLGSNVGNPPHVELDDDTYYESNSDATIPYAQGYPFSRTIHYPDGGDRPMRQSGPGDVHRLRSSEDRTVRINYANVTENELIRVFGDEAPDAATVYKVITTDPNASASVQYVEMTGKTIATCLSSSGGNPRLISLDSEPEVPDFDVTGIIEELGYQGSYARMGSQTLVLTQETTVTFNFSLTPKTVESACTELGICKTCDYEVEILLVSVDDPSDIVVVPSDPPNNPSDPMIETLGSYNPTNIEPLPELTDPEGPMDCPTGMGTFGVSGQSVLVEPGGYNVVLVIHSANEGSPLEMANILEEHLSDLRSVYDETFSDYLENSPVVNGTPLFDYLFHPNDPEALPDIDGFYTALEDYSLSSANLNAQGELISYTLEIEELCLEIEIPYLACESVLNTPDGTRTCDPQSAPPGLGFIDYFIDYWTNQTGDMEDLVPAAMLDEDGNALGHYPFLYSQYLNMAFVVPGTTASSGLPPGTEGDFEEVLANLAADMQQNQVDCPNGDCCEYIWECWMSVTAAYGGMLQIGGGDGQTGEVDLEEEASDIEMPDGVDNPMSNDMGYPDLPRMLFECIGWQYSNDPAGQVVTDDPDLYTEHPYKYIYYPFTDDTYTYNPCVDQYIARDPYHILYNSTYGICASDNDVATAPLLVVPEDENTWQICLDDPYDLANYADLEGFEEPIGTTLQGESYTISNAWEAFKSCLESEPDEGFSVYVNGQATEEGAVEATAENLNINCEEVCESRRESFRLALIDAYHQEGIYVQGDQYELIPTSYPDPEASPAQVWGAAELTSEELQQIEEGYSQGYEVNTNLLLDPDWMETYDYIPNSQLECMVQSLVEHCMEGCTFEYDENSPDSFKDQFLAQLPELQQGALHAFTSPFEVAFTDNGSCPAILAEDPVQRDFSTISAMTSTTTEMSFTGDDRAYRSQSFELGTDGVLLNGFLYLLGTVDELASSGLEFAAPNWAGTNAEANIWLVKADPNTMDVVDKWVYGGNGTVANKGDWGSKLLTDGTNLYIVGGTGSSNLDRYNVGASEICDCPIYGPDAAGNYSSDIWILKVNQNGTLLKAKTFGGNRLEWPTDAMISENGQLVVFAYSQSSANGLVKFSDAGLNGSTPVVHSWVFGIDINDGSDWDVLWDQAIGAYSEGEVYNSNEALIMPTALHVESQGTDNDVYVSAWTAGQDVNANNFDYSVLYKFSTSTVTLPSPPTNNFNVFTQTQKLGGNESVISDINAHSDGGLILAGSTMAPADFRLDDYRIEGVLSGTTDPFDLNSDLWLLKLNADLSYSWDRCYGSVVGEGSCFYPGHQSGDLAVLNYFVNQSSNARIFNSQYGEYVLVTTAENTDEVTLSQGGVRTHPGAGNATPESLDYWVVLVDDEGGFISDIAIGGDVPSAQAQSSYEFSSAVIGLNDETIAVFGTSTSDIGADRTWSAGGEYDMWLVTVDLGRCTHPDFCFRWLDFPIIEGEDVEPEECEDISAQSILNSVYSQVQIHKEEAVEEFEEEYMVQCVDDIEFTFDYNYKVGYHHYTLYYHDRAGNLIKTVPPEGVDRLDEDDLDIPDDETTMNRQTHPKHRMVTDYQANSLGQPVRQNTPDGGNTQFWHNALGQLRFSQNAQQAIDNEAAYTKYDNLGRVVEVGKVGTTGPNADFTDSDNLNDPNFPFVNTSERTFTYYTTPASSLPAPYGSLQLEQRYTQNRVSYTRTEHFAGPQYPEKFTYYSYDPHGNVEWLIQEIPGLDGAKLIKYRYDLFSGNVLQVSYQPDEADAFYHRYTYDADGRIEQVETSRDSLIWERDARYEYYAHGPLKRTVLGEDKVQGLDNVYTLQGWLKSLNHPSLDDASDPGQDGNHAINNVGRDAFGMSLYYHEGDFHHTGSPFDNPVNGPSNPDPYLLTLDNEGLYNGNIAGWVSNMDVPSVAQWDGLQAWQYEYDVLNRIRTADHYTHDGSQWSSTVDYGTQYTYDANGNIKTLHRMGSAGLAMDDLAYTYQTSPIVNNRLTMVVDSEQDPTAFNTDIDGTRYFGYDDNGNLTSDLDGQGNGIETIEWNLQGKIQSIERTSGSDDDDLNFEYDAMGNRVIKRVIDPNDPTIKETYYVRDAQGNIMATYQREYTVCGGGTEETIKLTERPIYGSSRIGQDVNEVVLRQTVCNGNTPQLLPSNSPRIPDQHIMSIVGDVEYRQISFVSPWGGLFQFNIPYHTIQRYDVTGPTPQLTQSRTAWLSGNITSVTAEDHNESLVFTGLISSNLFGVRLYLFDNANMPILGMHHITKVASGTQMLALQWDDSRWLLFTMDQTGQVFYHVIQVAPTIQVISWDNPLTETGGYANCMALIADHSETHPSRLYLKRRQTRNTPSMFSSIGLSLGGALPATEQVPDQEVTFSSNIFGFSGSGSSEIQISPDGTKLAVVGQTSQQGSLPIYHPIFGPIFTSVYVSALYVFELGADHRIVNANPDPWIQMLELQGNRRKIRSFDFSPSGESIYFSQTSLSQSVPPVLRRWNLSTNNVTDVFAEYTSCVRRADNGDMHALAHPDFVIIDDPDGTPLASTISIGTNGVGGHIRLQPHRIYNSEIPPLTRILGKKRYELNDHLGNVRAVVTDRKLSTLVAGQPQSFRAEIAGLNNYYPFGMQMEGREYFDSQGYRFGFNGMEKDDEVKGSGNSLDFGARIYDPRLGRFLSTDPQWVNFPGSGPYNYAANSPIAFIDKEGENPLPAWVIKALVRAAIQVAANVTVARKIGKNYDNLQGLNKRLDEIGKELQYLENGEVPPSGEGPELFGGGSHGGAGAGGSWVPNDDPMILKREKERQLAEKERKAEFFRENPDLKERMEQLQEEKANLEKQKPGLEKKQERLEKTQDALKQLNPAQIIDNVINIIDAQTKDEENSDDRSTTEIIDDEINKAVEAELEKGD